MNRHLVSSTCSAVIVLGLVSVVSSQTARPAAESPAAAPRTSDAAASTPAEDAEREKIWNSPTMLRARAWVQEYCQRSAKITPAKAQAYMTELSHLTPAQMKLWLLKFNAEEEMIRQQQAAFNASRQAGVQTGIGVQRATQQAYNRINQDETEAAQAEQGSLNAQQQLAAERGMEKVEDQDAAVDSQNFAPLNVGGYPPYGYSPWAGDGDFHLHYHVHQ